MAEREVPDSSLPPVVSPPTLAVWLLERICHPRYRDVARGDLDELYALRLEESGRFQAGVRYLMDVLSLGFTALARGRGPRRHHDPANPLTEILMGLIHDLRHAARSLRKSPGFSLVVMLTLALAIGANSAIFGVVDNVLLQPLPYEDPERIVQVTEVSPFDEGPSAIASQSLFLRWRESNQVFAQMAMYTSQAATLERVEGSIRLDGAAASPALFPLLGVEAVVGRTFAPDEEQPGRDDVVLLSHRAWQRYFGAEPDVVGRTVTLEGRSRTVVGVMPPGFRFPDDSVEYWVPMLAVPPRSEEEAARQGGAVNRTRTRDETGGDEEGDAPRGRGRRGGGGAEAEQNEDRLELMGRVIARLETGSTPDRAAEAGTAMLRGLREGPEAEAGDWRVEVQPLEEVLVGPVRGSLYILLGAVGFVLLIACANVANLVLARSVGRLRETAVRAALGAGRARLVRLLFAESLWLAAGGALIGTGLAWGGLRALQVASPDFIPRLQEVGLDARALLFTVAVALLTAALFSLAPARWATGVDLADALKDDGGSGLIRGAGRSLFRRLLVAAEMALSVVLLVGAGLLLASFVRLTSVDPGYDPDGLLHVQLALPADGYAGGTEHLQFYDRLLDRLRGSPEVREATIVSRPPYLPANIRVAIDRREPGEDASTQQAPRPVGVRLVGDGYFDTVRARMISGRGFTDADRTEDREVAVLSKSGAEALFGGDDPVGRRLDFMGGQQLEIVGVVADARTAGVDPTPQAEIFLPAHQFPERMVPQILRTAQLLVRGGGDPLALLPMVRSQLLDLDPGVVVYSAATVRDRMADTVAEPRFYAGLVGAFATVALLLAAVGVYGLLSYAVQQRIRDTAIRRALGAPSSQILRRVVLEGLALAAVGLLVGLGAALGLTRLLESMLYEVRPGDPRTLVAVAAVFLTVALVAVWLPARRAVRIDPMDVLRHEN